VGSEMCIRDRRESIQITKIIYFITDQGAFRKDFVLRDQIRRAIISVSSNIVEGYERDGNREFIRYLLIAKGSVSEAISQTILAREIGHLTKEVAEPLIQRLKILSSSIGGLVAYLKRYEKCNP